MAECTIICLDNSEWMRNGDYPRTRFEAQNEAAHSVLGYKTAHPESTVGVISLAGGTNVGVQVLCSPTEEKIKIMRAFANVKIGGKADIANGLQVAQLALKYKPSHFKSRVVLFVGSPIEVDTKKLIKIGKILKKVNIAVDIISLGEFEHNQPILEEFIQAVNKGDTSHLIVVPPGTYAEDTINGSAIGGGNQFAEYGGINPELDPELAAAMQESLLLAQAHGGAGHGAQGGHTTTIQDTSNMDDEEAKMIQEAMEMSLYANQDREQERTEETQTKGKAASTDMLDPDFMKSLVESMPGVDINNPEIQSLLQEKNDDKKRKKKDEKEDDKKDDKSKKK